MEQDSVVDLSVLVPAYQASGFIGDALDSVGAQLPVEGWTVEIIVADDGSTDDTRAVVQASGAADVVRYFWQENSGPSAARNLAIERSRGRFLMLLDADDTLCPDCLRTTLDFLDRHPRVGMFFTNYDLFDETGVTTASGVDLWKRFRGLAHDEPAPGEWIFTESLTPHIIEAGGFMHTSGLTVRREVQEKVGGFREGYSYGEDDEFYARVAWETEVGYVDRVLSRKRNHPGSLIHDPANRVRNAEHILGLSEIQMEYFRHDPSITAILERKIRDAAISWCWGLLQAGRADEARSRILHYARRYPGTLAFYRLWLRSWIPVRP